MNLKVNSKELLKALQTVYPVINANHTIPVLQNFLLEVTDKLTITATDLEVTMCTTISAEGSGSVVLPARLLLETIKALPEQVIEITPNENTVTLKAQSGTYKLPFFDAKDFPETIASDGHKITLAADVLATGIDKTLFALSTDTIRPEICSMLIEGEGDTIHFVGTDFHRLAMYSKSKISDVDGIKILIPRKPLTILKSLLLGGDVDVVITDKNAVFELDGVTVFCRLTDGKYPNYRAVIPTENPNCLVVSKSDIISSVKRTSMFANSYSKRIIMDINANSIRISCVDVDNSTEAVEDIPCNFTGEPLKIAFHAKILSEAFSRIDSDHAQMNFSTPKKGAILTPVEESSSDEALLILNMPMGII